MSCLNLRHMGKMYRMMLCADSSVRVHMFTILGKELTELDLRRQGQAFVKIRKKNLA